MPGDGDQTQTTTSEPWGEQKPYILDYYNRAEGQYNDPQEYFPGQSVAGRDSNTLLSRTMADEFLSGNRPADAANSFIGDVIGGEFMGGNPHLDSMFDTLSNKVTENYNRTVMPGVNSRFAGSGQSRSSGLDAARGVAQGNLADSLGDVGTQIYYGDYEARMGDRFKAVGQLGQTQAATYGDINLASAMGREDEGYAQNLINDAIARHNFSQQEPESRLDRFGSRVAGNSGYGTQTTTGIPGQGGNAGLSAGLGVLSLLASVVGSPALGAVVGAGGQQITG